MSFADWKKRSKLFLGYIDRAERDGIGLAECCQAAYKAGECAGLKTGEDIAKRAIGLRELMRSNVEVSGSPTDERTTEN